MNIFRSLKFDQSFNSASLAQCLTPKDFYLDNHLSDDDYRNIIIEKAVVLASQSAHFTPQITTTTKHEKPVYTVANLPYKLVLRKTSKNIRYVSNLTPKSRSKIIRELKGYLQEGTPYRIYRLDIQSFFESCNPVDILKAISQYNVSVQTQNILESFLLYFNAVHGPGIPRGIETSPILSEICLVDMDAKISKQNDVFYYSRFVDDIFIVTSSNEDKSEFLKYVKNSLPPTLTLNYNKTRVQDIPKRTIYSPSVVDVDYLGYKISAIDSDLTLKYPKKPSSIKNICYRDVVIDLSNRKVKKFKEKISKSLFSFLKNSDFRLLKDRLVFLSTNRFMGNKNDGYKLPTGIYYNYAELDYPSDGLDSIDQYLRATICAPKGRIGVAISGKLTATQKSELLKVSFSSGFRKRIFREYSPNRLYKIARIW